MNFNFFS